MKQVKCNLETFVHLRCVVLTPKNISQTWELCSICAITLAVVVANEQIRHEIQCYMDSTLSCESVMSPKETKEMFLHVCGGVSL